MSLTESFNPPNILHCTKMNKMREKKSNGDYSIFKKQGWVGSLIWLKQKLGCTGVSSTWPFARRCQLASSGQSRSPGSEKKKILRQVTKLCSRKLIWLSRLCTAWRLNTRLSGSQNMKNLRSHYFFLWNGKSGFFVGGEGILKIARWGRDCLVPIPRKLTNSWMATE